MKKEISLFFLVAALKIIIFGALFCHNNSIFRFYFISQGRHLQLVDAHLAEIFNSSCSFWINITVRQSKRKISVYHIKYQHSHGDCLFYWQSHYACEVWRRCIM